MRTGSPAVSVRLWLQSCCLIPRSVGELLNVFSFKVISFWITIWKGMNCLARSVYPIEYLVLFSSLEHRKIS